MTPPELYITRVEWDDGTVEDLSPRSRAEAEAWIMRQRTTENAAGEPYVISYQLVGVPQLALFAL